MDARKIFEDRISKLPDSILAFQILSRLPTLDAVRTCVLSKRWIHLWTRITSLNFDQCHYYNYLNYDSESGDSQDFPESGDFENFVSMVLLRLTTPSIESFSLLTSCFVDTSFLKTSWFPALAYRRIKNLTFSYTTVNRDDALISSRYIFSCHSLVQLNLVLDCRATIPNFVHLPNLKNLELSLIQFMPEKSGNSQEIILSFPVLKKLKSFETYWSDVQTVSFEVPLLEMVEIRECDSAEPSSINLCTTSLTYFSFDGYPSHHYSILSEPSSDVNTSSRIIFSKLDGLEEERKQWGIQACILLKQLNINHVKQFELSCTEVFSFVKDSFADLPIFNKLRHLKLSGVSGEMLIEFLLKSPYLTSLTVQMEEPYCKSDHAEKLLEFGIVPDSIHNTLKTFKIENFVGHDDQLSLAEYMMENADHLELLSLSPAFKDNIKRGKIKEKLFSCRRGLNLCIIDFYDLF